MTNTRTRTMTIGALMIAVTAVCAQIMLPLGPIQLSLQTFAVMLTGLLLPPSAAFCSLAGYLLLGLMGLPVFGGFRGGPPVVFGATGGFIMAFPLMALAISAIVRHLKLRGVVQLFAVLVASLVFCYLMGYGWFCIVTGATVSQAMAAAALPILPDLIKAAAAAWLSSRLRGHLGAEL